MASNIRIHDFDANAFTTFNGSQVVVSQRFVMFWKPSRPFGHWTPSPFEIDGIHSNCAEQYMIADKARLSVDTGIEEQILVSECPEQQKKLGK